MNSSVPYYQNQYKKEMKSFLSELIQSSLLDLVLAILHSEQATQLVMLKKALFKIKTFVYL